MNIPSKSKIVLKDKADYFCLSSAPINFQGKSYDDRKIRLYNSNQVFRSLKENEFQKSRQIVSV